VGGSVSNAATPADALRYHVLVTGTRPQEGVANGDADTAAAAGAAAGGAGGSGPPVAAAGRPGRSSPSINPMAVLADPVRRGPGWCCGAMYRCCRDAVLRLLQLHECVSSMVPRLLM
jgi:hypothetical protein